ncbi:hypothetical protein QUB68_14235, partial [Microcoleus sp. A006_D1]|uniref:hypothetical protein n=1 Tax=Microcoleus sp. A006_D1 TaxID=3055267 RepID=UPI002FD34319
NYLIVFSVYQWHRHLACEFMGLFDRTKSGFNIPFFLQSAAADLEKMTVWFFELILCRES